jgi:hypothetical protein
MFLKSFASSLGLLHAGLVLRIEVDPNRWTVTVPK